MFDRHLPARYQGDAPRVVRKPDGSDVWVWRGQQIPNIGLNAVVGRPPEEYGMEPTSFDQLRPGCYDVNERIRDMNANGVLASMCFPSFPAFCGSCSRAADDKDLAIVMLQAYNDWHIDEWCGSHPGRFIPLALPAIWDPEADGGRGAARGEEGLPRGQFSENPEKLGLPERAQPALGSRSGAPAPTPGPSSASTSARAPAWLHVDGRARRRDDHGDSRSTS